jgi:hypothetical protein
MSFWRGDGTWAAPAARAASLSVDASVACRRPAARITTTGTAAARIVINAQTGTSYALVAGDSREAHHVFERGGDLGHPVAGRHHRLRGRVVLLRREHRRRKCDLHAGDLDGQRRANIVLNSGMSAVFFSDGTNYRATIWQRGALEVNRQTGTSYTVLSTDRGKLVSLANASTIALTMPIATGAFGSGWSAWIQNTGAGSVVITPTTSTIDGAANLTLTTDQGILVASDGTNYWTMRGRPRPAGR